MMKTLKSLFKYISDLIFAPGYVIYKGTKRDFKLIIRSNCAIKKHENIDWDKVHNSLSMIVLEGVCGPDFAGLTEQIKSYEVTIFIEDITNKVIYSIYDMVINTRNKEELSDYIKQRKSDYIKSLQEQEEMPMPDNLSEKDQIRWKEWKENEKKQNKPCSIMVEEHERMKIANKNKCAKTKLTKFITYHIYRYFERYLLPNKLELVVNPNWTISVKET